MMPLARRASQGFAGVLELHGLPGRLLRRLADERALRQLEQDFARLMETALDAYRTAPRASGPKVGFATFGCGSWHFVLEALLAHAVALRGARPEFLICDMPALPICHERNITSRQQAQCPGCLKAKRPLVDVCGKPWRRLTDFVSHDALSQARAVVAALGDTDLERHEEAGWPIGRWLHVSSCHFLRCDGRGTEPEKIETRRRLLTSAIVVVNAVARWLDEIQPKIVIAQSGAHIMWRIARELAEARGIPVVCREMGKGGWDSHIYALDRDSMSPDLTKAWAVARNDALSPAELEQVDAYLEALPAKTYNQNTGLGRNETSTGLRELFEVPPGKRVAVLFTNVTWDLATAGRDIGFDGVLDWVKETIRTVSQLQNVHLVLRAHPAEANVITRERILDRIREEWPGRPPHVTLVAPEQRVTVRALCEIADLVLAYCSTAGIEAAAYGAPVLLCGDPHYRGKGFTIDVASRWEYAAMVHQWANGMPVRPPAAASELARRYVNLFFLRYHVPMGLTTSPLEPPYRLEIKTLAELIPGRNHAVDTVCSGILHGRQILMPHGPHAGSNYGAHGGLG